MIRKGGVFLTKKMDLRVWTEGTMIAALGVALSFIPVQSVNAGLDLSLGLVPLVLYSYRRGFVPGVTAGFMWGLLNILVGSAMKNFISVPQIIFEYPFAFAFGGFGGLFANRIQQALRNKANIAYWYIGIGGFIAVVCRWFWHFWAGVFVWGMYAPEGQSPYVYSLIFNGGSVVINTIYVSVVFILLAQTAPKLFLPKG